MIDVLKNQKYRVFLITDFLSIIGDGLFYIALMTFATSISKNGYAISLVSISETLPLLFTFFTGLLADLSTNRYKDLKNIYFMKTIIYLVVALILGFSSSLITLIVICILNFISDCLGRISIGICSIAPQMIFKQEQWEDSSALYSTNQQIAQIISQSIGGALVLYFTFKNIAFINTGIFLLVFFIFIFNKNVILNVYKTYTKDSSKQGNKNVKQELTDFFKLKNNKSYFELFQSLLSITIINSVLSTIPSILSIAFINFNTSFNYSIFLTFLLSGNTISTILGSTVGIKITKNKNLNRYILYANLVSIMFFISISINKIILSLIMSWILYFIIGIVNPKLNTLFRKTIPIEEYAKITGAFGSFMSIGSVLGSIIYNLSASKNIFVFTTSMTIILTVYFIYTVLGKKEKRKE